MTKASELPNGLVETVVAELEPAEQLIWAEQPIPRLYARGYLLAFLFGIPWTVGSLYMIYEVVLEGRALHTVASLLAIGILFLLVGCMLMFSPFWMMRRAKRTAYIITARRALIFNAGWFGGHTIRSFRAEQLQDIHRFQRADGAGDLILERHWRDDSEGSRQAIDEGFLAIRDPKMVEGLIKELANAHSLT